MNFGETKWKKKNKTPPKKTKTLSVLYREIEKTHNEAHLGSISGIREVVTNYSLVHL